MKIFFAYNLQEGWRNGIYICIEIKSCSKESIAVLSFLTLHITYKTTEAISLILKKEE